jgi:hypothetical protein
MYSISSSAWKQSTGHTATQSVKRHLLQFSVTMKAIWCFTSLSAALALPNSRGT